MDIDQTHVYQMKEAAERKPSNVRRSIHLPVLTMHSLTITMQIVMRMNKK